MSVWSKTERRKKRSRNYFQSNLMDEIYYEGVKVVRTISSNNR